MTCWKVKGCKDFFNCFHFDLADINQYFVTLYAPLVGVDRPMLEYGVGSILAIYGEYKLQVTCGSKPRDFFPALALYCYMLLVLTL